MCRDSRTWSLGARDDEWEEWRTGNERLYFGVYAHCGGLDVRMDLPHFICVLIEFVLVTERCGQRFKDPHSFGRLCHCWWLSYFYFRFEWICHLVAKKSPVYCAISPIIPSAPKCSSRHFIFHRKCNLVDSLPRCKQKQGSGWDGPFNVLNTSIHVYHLFVTIMGHHRLRFQTNSSFPYKLHNFKVVDLFSGSYFI